MVGRVPRHDTSCISVQKSDYPSKPHLLSLHHVTTFLNCRQQLNIFSPCSRRWSDARLQTEAGWDRYHPHCARCSQIPCATQGDWGMELWWAPGPLVCVLLAVPAISGMYHFHITMFHKRDCCPADIPNRTQIFNTSNKRASCWIPASSIHVTTSHSPSNS
jgi:hypothetical protein